MTYVCKDCGHLASEHNIDGCGFKHCSCVKLCVPVTPRELSVWKGIASGKTVKDLATSLFLSVKTVDSHVWNLHQKLGVHNRTQLTILALSLGLIEPADIPTPNVSVALPV